MTTTRTSDKKEDASPPLPLRVAFLHLDWGIGGAEQLMLQLAQVTVALGHGVALYTTRCEPSHCFAPLQPSTGVLYPFLHVHGRWIPQDIAGRFRAICSTIRLLYLAWCMARTQRNPAPDVIVLDVLPTPLPFLQYLFPTSSLLFYCHFPDQLLIQSAYQNRKDNEENATTSETTPIQPTTTAPPPKGWYRTIIDFLENQTMPFADTIVVNSHFTRRTVLETFPSLQQQQQAQPQNQNDNFLPVLYPALDTSALDAQNDNDNDNTEATVSQQEQRPIVSLNRFERKKNLELLLQAVQWLESQKVPHIPPIIIAGGYDPQNIENVQYRGELQHFCDTQLSPSLQRRIQFQQSISDAQRTSLLRNALAVVYTPTNEHFGIVPLEAMYSGTPVVAVNAGGPTETVVHGQTGFLCDPTPAAFGHALQQLMQEPSRAHHMGQAGRTHVQARFGPDTLQTAWKDLLEQTLLTGRARHATTYRVGTTLVTTLVDVACVTLSIFVLTWLLQGMQVLEPGESLWNGLGRLGR